MAIALTGMLQTKQVLKERLRRLSAFILSYEEVNEYSVLLYRGALKKVTLDPSKFHQGELVGNIRCFACSAGCEYFEALEYRPAQPPANPDSGTCDSLVKIKWDGMVNTTDCRVGTCSPVFNQNVYFPVRLIDGRELRHPLFIEVMCIRLWSMKRFIYNEFLYCFTKQRTLPLDLQTKGPIIFEVWDQDDASSDFLGGCELQLSKMWKDGRILVRCLAEGIESQKKTNFRTNQANAPEVENEEQDEEDAGMSGFEIPYQTLVYSGNGSSSAPSCI